MQNIKFRGAGVGAVSYVRILASGTTVWSTSGGTGALTPYGSPIPLWTDQAISATEQGSTNIFIADVPTALPAGVYDVDARTQVGGAPAITDPGLAQGDFQWDGTQIVPLASLATSGQIATIGPIRIARGTQIAPFLIYLKSAADHISPFTSGVVSGQISKDGGVFGALQSGAFTEVGQGFYSLQALTSGDTSAMSVGLLFRATGISGGISDPLPMTIITQKVSGSV